MPDYCLKEKSEEFKQFLHKLVRTCLCQSLHNQHCHMMTHQHPCLSLWVLLAEFAK